MCSSPITIKNPYFRLGSKGYNFLKNTVDSHIQVPCGNCPQCVAMRQSFFLQRVQMESLRSDLFYFTLTYNDQSLVFTEDLGDYNLPFPVFEDVQNMFKRLRSYGYNFRATYVSEYGRRRHRPHFHGILAVEKSSEHYSVVEKRFKNLFWTEWRRNYGSSRCPLWYPLFTPVYKRGRCTTFDFHYIEPIKDHDNDCSYYVSKYITKYDSWIRSLISKIALDDNLSGEESMYLISLLKPRCNTSKDFGSWDDPKIYSYVNKCASRESLFTWPQFYDIYTGKQMPMSPYYGKHLVDFAHLYKRFDHSSFKDFDSTGFVSFDTILDLNQDSDSVYLQNVEFRNKLKKLENRLLE